MGARGTDRLGAGRGRMARLSRCQLLPHLDGLTHAPGDRIEATLDDRIEATLDALCSFRGAAASLGHGGACAFKTCDILARATARAVLGVSWKDTSEQAGTATALRGSSLGPSRSRGGSVGQTTSASLARSINSACSLSGRLAAHGCRVSKPRWTTALGPRSRRLPRLLKAVMLKCAPLSPLSHPGNRRARAGACLHGGERHREGERVAVSSLDDRIVASAPPAPSLHSGPEPPPPRPPPWVAAKSIALLPSSTNLDC